MRTRRFLALLLTLALLMGAACAESDLRPRRDGGPVTEMTQPTGELLSQQRWTGAFTVDRNGRAQTWQLDISYGEYEDGMLLQASATPESGEGGSGMGSEESSAPVKYDTLFAEIAREAVSSGQISTSMIQRNYEVGFNRAGRIMLQLERAGIVGRQQGAKPRDILFHDLPSLEAKLQDLGLF